MAKSPSQRHNKQMKRDLSHEDLRRVVHYNPETGIFTRLSRPRGKGKVGDKAGWVNSQGYLMLSVLGCYYLGSRLAWFYVTGKWPKADIDHENKDHGDNRWSNLREATRAQNLANRGRHRDNKSGWKGVCAQTGCKNWRATIGVNRKQIALGTFDCPVAAHFAYVVAAAKHYGEFARGA